MTRQKIAEASVVPEKKPGYQQEKKLLPIFRAIIRVVRHGERTGERGRGGNGRWRRIK